ncbi:MAG: T9SS type A sorting domain-containing protein [Ignavibacteria bacterium]
MKNNHYNIFSLLSLLSFIFIGSLTGQTSPSAQQVPYFADFSSLSHTTTSYSSGWQGWKVSTATSGMFNLSAPSANTSLIASGYASGSVKGVYNYKGKLGFLNAADGDYSLVLSLNTTTNSNIVVEYAVMTLRNPYNGTTNNRISGLELQYRVGTTGNFKSVNSRVYINNTTSQTGTTTIEQNRQVFAVELPSECNNLSVVQVRWVTREISGSGSYPSFAIDDVDIMSNGKASYYYYKGTGSLVSLTSWTSHSNGTGFNPVNFTDGYQYFVLTSPSLVTFDGNWTVSGVNTKVIIGDGMNNVTLKTINSAQINAVVDVRSGSKFVIAQSTSNFPVFGNLYPGSSIEILFSASLPYIPAGSTYENLLLNSSSGSTYQFTINSPDILVKEDFTLINTSLNNSGTEKFKLQVGGNFTLSSGASLSGNFSNLAELVLNGTTAQTIQTNGIALNLNGITNKNTAGVTLLSTGGFTNLNISSGTANFLNMNGGNIELGSNSITLGSSVSEPGTLNCTSGFITGTGSFSRWFGNSGLPVAGTLAFPLGTGVNNRSIYIWFSSSAITSGGKLSATHSNLTGSTTIAPYTDGTFTINKRSNMSWQVTQSNNWNLGTATLSVKFRADGLSGVSDVSSLTLVKNNIKSGGTFSSGTGSPSQPEVTRLAMSITDLGGAGTANTFYIGAGVGNPLPVVLSSFSCKTSNRDVELNWVTSSEINNKGFEIERCIKDVNTGSFSAWEKIGFVSGKGTTNNENVYTYGDKKLSDGTYRFRIKQVDYNGNSEYFILENSQEAVIGKPVKFSISQNYPNPSNPVSKIDFELPFDAKVTLKVYDLTGKEVASLVDGDITSGFHTTEFNGVNLSSGAYFYRINASGSNGETFTKTMKMILVK